MYVVNPNGGSVMPQEDDIISWSGGDWGHVGVVAEVVYDETSGTGQVYTVEQNVSDQTGLFVQDLTRSYNDEGQSVYNVGGRPEDLGSYQVQGWAHYDTQSRLTDVFDPGYTSTSYTPATKPLDDQPSD